MKRTQNLEREVSAVYPSTRDARLLTGGVVTSETGTVKTEALLFC
ncbi:MAG TPA: hypothetical protein PKE07_06685 [Lacibacter sp.]|nr:hypothetical protein [Lacibacter sp.]HMO90203.1 hypothetical protein [Lacibacter sp.]